MAIFNNHPSQAQIEPDTNNTTLPGKMPSIDREQNFLTANNNNPISKILNGRNQVEGNFAGIQYKITKDDSGSYTVFLRNESVSNGEVLVTYDAQEKQTSIRGGKASRNDTGDSRNHVFYINNPEEFLTLLANYNRSNHLY
jgi:hypothetical protein